MEQYYGIAESFIKFKSIKLIKENKIYATVLLNSKQWNDGFFFLIKQKFKHILNNASTHSAKWNNIVCIIGRWVSIKFNFIMLYICFENIIINMFRSWLLADRVYAPLPLNYTSTTAHEYFTSAAPTTKTLWYCLVFSCLDALLPATMMIAQRNWLTEADTISFNNIIVFN